MNTLKRIVFISFIMLIANCSLLIAQPSGGPYGPIRKTYELPQDAKTIYYVAPDGNPKSKGTKLSKPTTLESAIEKVVTGDAIILRGGVYRTGNLKLNQGITIQPYKDEAPILKGTFIAKDWQNLGNGLWKTKWTRLFPSQPDDWWRYDREGKKTPLHKFNNDMVFVDGKFLQSAGWQGEVDENSFFIDYDRENIYIGVNPTDKLIEITAFNVAVHRVTEKVHGKKSDKIGPVIRGITFTQYAYRAFEIDGKYPEGISPESEHGKDVVGTTLEHCEISFCSRVAGYFRGDNMVIRNCKISDTSTEGLYIIASADVLLEKNIFQRNNIERITGYYPAAVKIFNQCYRTVCNDNLVIDQPYSNGIWYDVGNVDGVFTNNWIEGVGSTKNEFSIEQPWPSDNGFFFEISKGAVCAGNVFVNCDHGVWALNSCEVKFYNNTFINSTACIARNERSAAADHFGWHPSTGPDVDERVNHVFVNNLMYGDETFQRPLFYVWQPATLCDELKEPQLKQLDHNVYVRKPLSTEAPLIWWSPVQNEKCREAYTNLEGLQKLLPEFAQNSKYFHEYEGPLFKSENLGDYQLLPDFSGAKNAAPLPENIQKLLKKNEKSVGAFNILK